MERRCKTLPNEETLRFLTVEEVKRLHLLALRMYLEDGNFRRIARLLGVHHQTVINWIKVSQAALKERGTTPPQPDTVETTELDELWTFVGSKKNGATSSLS